MKISIKIIILFSFIMILGSCKLNEKYTLNSTYAEFKEMIEKKNEELSSEQLLKKQQLINIIQRNIIIKDNIFYNLSKPNDFEKIGLSKYYHTILDKSIEEANQFIKDENINNVDSIYKKSIIDLLK